MVDLDYLRQVERELRYRQQVLVEIAEQTRWEHPELVITGEPPTKGYALASTTTHRVRRRDKPYITDVNFDHRWRQFEDVYADLAQAAKALGI